MGWRNYFIRLKNDKNKGYDIDFIEKFIDDHNSYYSKFTREELEKMEDWTLPGEDLSLEVLIRHYDDKKKNESNTNNSGDKYEYWAYLGNHGGSSHTFNWMEIHYPDLKMFGSSDFPYYNDNWQEWELINVDEYKNRIK